MAFCLWPNQAAAVAVAMAADVESPSGVIPRMVFAGGDGSSYVHHNETGTSNTTPLEGLISTVFLFFWGRDDLAKTP